MTTSKVPVHIRAMYISPGHDFKGHHGKPRGHHPIYTKDEIECVAGKGIVGDRYFDHIKNFKGQVTFFDWDVYRELREKFFNVGFNSSSVRRNVVIEGVDLDTLVGIEFKIQGIRFSGSEHCAPCYWMEEAVGEGAEQFLTGRGGLRARILSSGRLARGRAQLIVERDIDLV